MSNAVIFVDEVGAFYQDGHVFIELGSGGTRQTYALSAAKAKTFYDALRTADYQADLGK